MQKSEVKEALASIKCLSNDELAAQLKACELFTCPVNKLTRNVCENRLLQSKLQLENDTTTQQLDDACQSKDNPLIVPTESMDVSVEISDCKPSYFGVFSDNNSEVQARQNGEALVFTSQKEALCSAKSMKNARFKLFSCRDDAVKFSVSGLRTETRLNGVVGGDQGSIQSEPGSAHRSPTTQDCAVFRKSIERGDIEFVREKCSTNPRYLINSADSPTIIQEGSRYNAIHVAVKANQLAVCQFVMTALQQDSFWRNLFQEDSLALSVDRRKEHAMDSYLNTPDKFSFTPLHLACKLGHVSILEYLLSIRGIDKLPRNNRGETPPDVTCTQYKGESGILSACKASILELFVGRSIVPVLQKDAVSLIPTIGEPIEQNATLADFPLVGKKTKNGDVVRAYAGPMSPCKAQQFFNDWKRSPKKGQNMHVALSDYDKGFERIGRTLAHKEKVPWQEFWPFLGCYADLSSPGGLRLLEDYLRAKLDTVEATHSSVPATTIGESSKNTPIDDCKRNLTDIFDNENLQPTVPDSPAAHTSGTGALRKLFGNTTMTDDDKEHSIEQLLERLGAQFIQLSLSPEELERKTANPDGAPFFIVGNEPSKHDMDVLRAIQTTHVGNSDFPLVTRWREAVESFNQEDRNHWPSPASLRIKSRLAQPPSDST